VYKSIVAHPIIVVQTFELVDPAGGLDQVIKRHLGRAIRIKVLVSREP
jgi:hypothetical protein